MVNESVSEKTVLASSKVMECFLTLFRAFSVSHSNSNIYHLFPLLIMPVCNLCVSLVMIYFSSYETITHSPAVYKVEEDIDLNGSVLSFVEKEFPRFVQRGLVSHGRVSPDRV